MIHKIIVPLLRYYFCLQGALKLTNYSIKNATEQLPAAEIALRTKVINITDLIADMIMNNLWLKCS